MGRNGKLIGSRWRKFGAGLQWLHSYSKMLAIFGADSPKMASILEEIPTITHARVIVTVLEEWPEPSTVGTPLKIEDESPPEAWWGALANTATIVGDIVQPLEETLADWEVLRHNRDLSGDWLPRRHPSDRLSLRHLMRISS